MPKKKRKTRASTDTSGPTEAGTGNNNAPPPAPAQVALPPELPVHDHARIDKQRGDEEYHRGNFSAAISYYTKAIALSGSNPFFLVTLFTNRAVAHIHLKEYLQAVDDCNVAIRLDPTHIRAYMCRAFASFYLQRFTHALNDYERASNLQPENTQLRQKLQKAKEAFEAFKKKPQNTQKQNKAKSDGEWSGWMEDIDVNLALLEEADTAPAQPSPAPPQNSSPRSPKEAPPREPPVNTETISTPAKTQQTQPPSSQPTPPPSAPKATTTNTATAQSNGGNESGNNISKNKQQSGQTSPSSKRHTPLENEHDPCDCPLLVPVGEALDAYPTDSDMLPLAQAKELAFKEKELGNNAFTAGDYLVALVHYSRAIKLYSREPIFFSNRALVYLKLQRYYESITDCTASIDRKPSIKAYARRATAWISLKEHNLAAEDYRKALKFESKNQDCLEKLLKCLSYIEEDYQKKLQSSPSNENLKRELQRVRDEQKRLNTCMESRANASSEASGGNGNPPPAQSQNVGSTQPAATPATSSTSSPPATSNTTTPNVSPTTNLNGNAVGSSSNYPKRPTQW